MTHTQVQPPRTTSQPIHTQRKYRYDLDGLRGIAIGLVVIFHVFVGKVSGGVDVFLLLSGFFFLGSQLRYAAKPRASLNPWWPIWRLMRRLIPALAVVVGTTALAIWFFTPLIIKPELIRQFTASIFYFLNWELISQEAAYAAANVDTSPLQHLWSMSVQGQFYLLAITFALILAVLARLRHWDEQRLKSVAGPILIVVTIASFAWASRHGWVGTPENYYSLFSRLWELTLGATLAIYAPLLQIPQRFAASTTIIGLAMIVATGIVIPTSLAFPGPATLLPIGGAVLIILTNGRGRPAEFLASPPARWLGSVAYSLYLWHWPLLILLTIRSTNDEPSVLLGFVVIIASLALADVTHRFIEKPLQQHVRRPLLGDAPVHRAFSSLQTVASRARAVGGVIIAAIMVFLASIQPYYDYLAKQSREGFLPPESHPGAMALHGHPVPDERTRPGPFLAYGVLPQSRYDGCLVPIGAAADYFPIDDPNLDASCIYGTQDAETTVVLAGGSHVEPWTDTLNILGQEHGFRVVTYFRESCPIVLGPHYGVTPECSEWSEMVVDRIIDLNPEVVISTTTRPSAQPVNAPEYVAQGYEAFWQRLEEAQIPFLGLRDNPWYVNDNFEIIDPNMCTIVLGSSHPECNMPREYFYAESDPAAEILQYYTYAEAIDTADWYCTEDTCPANVGNISVYQDQNHISRAYAISAAPLLWEHLAPYVLD